MCKIVNVAHKSRHLFVALWKVKQELGNKWLLLLASDSYFHFHPKLKTHSSLMGEKCVFTVNTL